MDEVDGICAALGRTWPTTQSQPQLAFAYPDASDAMDIVSGVLISNGRTAMMSPRNASALTHDFGNLGCEGSVCKSSKC